MLGGARFANRLGLTRIDEAALEDCLIHILTNMRAHVAEAGFDIKQAPNITAILQDYLNAMVARHTLVTNMFAKRGTPAVKTMQDTSRLEGVYVQRALDEDKIRISEGSLRGWLSEQRFSPTMIVDEIVKQFHAKRGKAIMGGGTANADQFMTAYLELDLTNTVLATQTSAGSP
jgi:hypothetical protein